MGSTRYKQHAGGVSTLHYHFVWCPKYRRKVLQGAIAARLKALLHEKAEALGVTVEGLEVLPDHVHLFVTASRPMRRSILPTSSRGIHPACCAMSSLA